MIGRNSSTLRLTLIASLSVLLATSGIRAETPERASPAALGPSGQAEPTVSPDEIASLMPLLVPLPEQKRLAAELRALLESSDARAGSRKLTVAVEVGALASILLDWIGYPALLTALQALPDDGGEMAVAPTASLPVAPNAAETALAEELNDERVRSAALSEELSTIKTDFLALKTSREQEATAAAAASEDLHEMLKRQEERAEAATRELASVTQELASLKFQREKETVTAAADTGDLSRSLKAQEERADANARELATVGQEFAALKSLREREKAELAAETANLVRSLKGEEERANASARDLTVATKELETLRAARDREIATTSGEVTDLRQALAREKARSDDATRKLAVMMDEMREMRNARAASGIPGLDRVAPIGAAGTAPELLHAPPPILATGAIGTPSDPATAAPSPADSSRPATPPPAADDRLTARADLLFRSGDVSGARLLLERAQEAGNARAIFLLAETFDPNALASIGAVGIRSDPARARELYGRALALGIAPAGARMEALK